MGGSNQSGKTESLFGGGEGSGLVGTACQQIFLKISQSHEPNTFFEIEVSMFEIYNEKVHDLLESK